MSEPNLDEQVSDFMASLFIKHRVYHAEPDPAVVAEWVEFIANQVREARLDERSQAQQYLHGLTITPENQHLFDVLSRNNHERIATINGVRDK